MVTRFFKRIPFYPLLLGLYPVLFLWSANFNQVLSFVVLRSLIVSMGITFFVCLVCLAVLRKLLVAAAMAGLILALFFSYGQFFSLVDTLTIFGFMIGRHRFVLPLWGVMFAVGAFWILRTKSDLHNLTGTLNLIGSFLVALTLVKLGSSTITDLRQDSRVVTDKGSSSAVASVQKTTGDTPDVYYIVLDGYDRHDLLLQDIHLDNSNFLSQLEGLGFVIPNCTQSNYTTTVTSIASTLNMDYTDNLGISYSEMANVVGDNLTNLMQPFTKHNLVMEKFREAGYKIITLKSIWPFIDYPDSDIVYDVHSDASALQKVEAFSFQYMFMRTTMMRILIEDSEYAPEKFQNLPAPLIEFITPKFNKYESWYIKWWEQNKYQLSSLENVAKVPGKKFLYAHLIVTHQPFTFTPSGDLQMYSDESKEGYGVQVAYVDARIITIVKNILAQSKIPPVIILQGDHGFDIETSRHEQTFKILNAYYLPQNGITKIYPTITPVNTFRLIFSYYFNQNYPLLPDNSIWINNAFPDGYKIAPQTCVN